MNNYSPSEFIQQQEVEMCLCHSVLFMRIARFIQKNSTCDGWHWFWSVRSCVHVSILGCVCVEMLQGRPPYSRHYSESDEDSVRRVTTKKNISSNLPVSNHSCNPIITDPRSFINYCSRIDVIHLNLWNSFSCHLSRSVNTVTVERNQWSADFLHLCPEVTAEMCVWTLHVISCMSSPACHVHLFVWFTPAHETFVMFTLYLTISDRWQHNRPVSHHTHSSQKTYCTV